MLIRSRGVQSLVRRPVSREIPKRLRTGRETITACLPSSLPWARLIPKLFGAAALIVVPALTATAQAAAGASTTTPKSSLAKDLLPPWYAKKIGFTKVTQSPVTSTGDPLCPHNAEELFENAKGTLDLLSGAATCISSQGALREARSRTLASSATPPKQLGPSAIERHSAGLVYEMYWFRGRTLEVVEIGVIPPSSRHSRPITPALQKLLSSAALEQNGLFR
jgi:hypothetical protein